MNKQKHQKILKDTLNELNHIIEEKKDFICSCGSCDIVVSLALNFKVGHICPESFNELNNIICIDSIEKNDIEKICIMVFVFNLFYCRPMNING